MRRMVEPFARGERRARIKFYYHSPHTFFVVLAYVAFKFFFQFEIKLGQQGILHHRLTCSSQIDRKFQEKRLL